MPLPTHCLADERLVSPLGSRPTPRHVREHRVEGEGSTMADRLASREVPHAHPGVGSSHLRLP